MDIGLFLLRVYLGALLLGHGSQKLFGAFGGLGPAGTAPLFDAWGIRPARPLVLLAGTTEVIAAALMILGLLTPLAAAMLFGTLLVAVSVIAENGLWAVRGGYELPLVYAWIAACLGFTGPGGWSLDAALGLAPRWGLGSGLMAMIAGALAAGVLVALARRNLRRASASLT